MKKKIGIVLAISFASLACSAQSEYEKYIEQGIEATKSTKYSEAENLFNKALEVEPDNFHNALIYMNLGKVQEYQNKNVEAVESYSKAIEKFPQTITFLRARADLYLKLGNFVKAIGDYTTIIDLDPKNIEVRSCRGYAYGKQKELDKAKADYLFVIDKDPDNYMAAFGLAMIELQMGHTQQALSQIGLLIESFPEKAELYATRAQIENDSKQSELAILDLNKAIELEPTNKSYILSRANTYLLKKDKYKAKQDFEKLINLGVSRAALQSQLKECE